MCSLHHGKGHHWAQNSLLSTGSEPVPELTSGVQTLTPIGPPALTAWLTSRPNDGERRPPFVGYALFIAASTAKSDQATATVKSS